jgi:hypothetical protein
MKRTSRVAYEFYGHKIGANRHCGCHCSISIALLHRAAGYPFHREAA